MTTVARPARKPARPGAAGTTIRPVETRAEYEACVELQRETWGRTFSDVVPVSMMGIAVKMGGICLGAFDSGGGMLGFVFGVTGPRDGELAHWSHMLAVRSEARNAGIGRQLKFAQRKALAERGVDTLYWTFDPLVARNAHFNLNRLGATVAEFVPDMYGNSDSELHRLGTDRFIARWSLRGGGESARSSASRLKEDDVSVVDGGRVGRVVPDRVATGTEGGVCGSAHAAMGKPGCNGRVPLGADLIEVLVPRDIDAVAAKSFEEALAWRCANNAALTRLFSEGYDLVGFRMGEEHGRYVMARRPGISATGGDGA